MKRFVAVLACCAVLALSYRNVVWPMLRGEAFVANPQHFNFATLPVTAPRETPVRPPVQFADAEAGAANVIEWQPEYRVIQTQATRATELQLRVFDYPGWTLLLDGRSVPHGRGDDGEIVFAVPAGHHQIVAEFRATPIRAASNWMTALAAFIWLLFFFKQLQTKWRSQHETVGETF